jgi:hypothetical protein
MIQSTVVKNQPHQIFLAGEFLFGRSTMAKRSRRERRQEIDKRRVPTPGLFSLPATDSEDIPSGPAAQAETPIAAAPNRKVVNFAQEYYHVYVELRNIIVISILMFVVMWALQFLI